MLSFMRYAHKRTPGAWRLILATTALQNSIVALRKLLGADLLETKHRGYRLVVARESIDLGRFEQLVASSRGLDPSERLERLREALALWRGEPLAEIAAESFASPEARRLGFEQKWRVPGGNPISVSPTDRRPTVHSACFVDVCAMISLTANVIPVLARL